VIDGNLWNGRSGIAGEVGHTIVQINGPRCACGNRGCLEALASGTAIVRNYQERKRMKQSLTARQVVERARKGDMVAASVVRQAGEALGVGIANVFHLVNPALILLGGGVSRAGKLLIQPAVGKARSLIRPALRRYLRIRRGQLGDDAGVLGAAYLGFRSIGLDVHETL